MSSRGTGESLPLWEDEAEGAAGAAWIEDPEAVRLLEAAGAVGVAEEQKVGPGVPGPPGGRRHTPASHARCARGRGGRACRYTMNWRSRGSVVQPSQLPGTVTMDSLG